MFHRRMRRDIHEQKATRVADRGAAEHVFPRLQSPLTLNPEPNSIRNPLPSLGNNTTLENIDGVIGYSYTCIDNGEVVVIYWVGCRGEYRNNRLMG